MIRIAITGPESSGKSDLSKNLAGYYNTVFAPEYARTYLENTMGKYDFGDLDKICQGQIQNEKAADEIADRIVFYDTDMMVLKVWSEFRYGKLSEKIQQAYKNSNYDSILLCMPDLPWYDDPLRESPSFEERMELFEIYQNLVKKDYPEKHTVIQGVGNLRIEKAIRFLEKEFNISP